jgi:hypothetical protein
VIIQCSHLLKKNPKLIQKIKKISPLSKLIGFKLTSTTDATTIQNKINGLFETAQCDYVVQNDWSSVQTGRSIFNMYSKNGKIENLTIDDLAIEIMQIILNQEPV